MSACVIFFIVGLFIGIFIAWIREDNRINKLTVENRELYSDNTKLFLDNKKLTEIILKLKNGSQQ